MPDYYAHLSFGRAVLQALPEELAKRIQEEQAAYECGQYGPDPLYFYHPLSPRSPRREGIYLHHNPFDQMLERYRRPVEEGKPFCAGYAAGLICHFALDSRCHPYINNRAAAGDLTHAAIESAFDASLMLRDGIDPHHMTPMPDICLPEGVYAAAAVGYEKTTAELYRRSLLKFYRCTRWMTRFNGTVMRHVFNGAVRVIPKAGIARDAVLAKRPLEKTLETNGVLRQMLLSTVPVGAAMVESFFRAVETGQPLEAVFHRDFMGGTAPVVSQAASSK